MLLIPTLLCPKAWEGMSGNEAQRFCTHCKKHVHNLEAMSAADRLALFSSPAASICSRYRVAIRRPAKGKEQSYCLHLAKHGAGVAVIGTVLLVLWEMQGQEEKETYYRVSGVRPGCPMPPEYYDESLRVVKGDVACPPSRRQILSAAVAAPNQSPVENPDLRIDPKTLAGIVDETGPNLVPLQPNPPPEKQKAGESPALKRH